MTNVIDIITGQPLCDIELHYAAINQNMDTGFAQRMIIELRAENARLKACVDAMLRSEAVQGDCQ